ncbi:hypothetical protein [Fredinandcohnia sp. 179-A 10B2 NHS]
MGLKRLYHQFMITVLKKRTQDKYSEYINEKRIRYHKIKVYLIEERNAMK